MKEETKKYIQEKINTEITDLRMKGVHFTNREEVIYREGVALGLALSISLFNDFSSNEILDACGLTSFNK